MVLDQADIGQILLTVFLGMVLSFVGSLPPGLINLTVSRETLRRGTKPAFLIALGASSVELLQALISVEFSQLFSTYPKLKDYFQWIAILVFLGLGIYFFFSSTEMSPPEKTPTYKDFGLGVVISALNFLAYPYWIFYGTLFQSKGWLETHLLSSLLFAIGVGVGTFFALWTYVSLSQHMRHNLPSIFSWANKVLGSLFVFLAGWQIVQLLGS